MADSPRMPQNRALRHPMMEKIAATLRIMADYVEREAKRSVEGSTSYDTLVASLKALRLENIKLKTGCSMPETGIDPDKEVTETATMTPPTKGGSRYLCRRHAGHDAEKKPWPECPKHGLGGVLRDGNARTQPTDADDESGKRGAYDFARQETGQGVEPRKRAWKVDRAT